MKLGSLNDWRGVGQPPLQHIAIATFIGFYSTGVRQNISVSLVLQIILVLILVFVHENIIELQAHWG